jgi:hypothetical protein
VIDRADREQIAWSYSGIHALHPVPIPHGMHGMHDALRLGQGWHDALRLSTASRGVLAMGHAVHSTLVA